MTLDPHRRYPEDESLLQFLQDHAATPPPPAPELEDRIMTAIQAESPEFEDLTPVPLWRQRVIWLPTTLAAGITLLWISMQGMMAPEPALTVAEQAELELFLESTWSGVIETSDGEDLKI